jgi:hypothetical protein
MGAGAIIAAAGKDLIAIALGDIGERPIRTYA